MHDIRSPRPVPRMRATCGLGLAFLAALASVLAGCGRADRWSLPSGALGERRHVLVHLPQEYDRRTESFPLLVLLDGGDEKMHSRDRPLYTRATERLTALQREGIPGVILVGIENRNRVRDMTPVQRPDIYVGGGGARPFVSFLEDEVIPFVASRWRIGPTRILYGESYGGLLVLDALARGRGRFTDYVAVSPAVGVWPDGLATALRHQLGKSPDVRSLSIIYGSNDAPLVTDFTPPLIHAVSDQFPPGLRWQVDVIPDGGHSPESSLERGVRFVFQRPAATR